jgi:hypothetical protein
MPKLETFAGLNNRVPAAQMPLTDLHQAVNIDLDQNGKPSRRAGFAIDSATVHNNLWEGRALTLATRGAGGDLVNVGSGAVLAAALGHTPRVWFHELPDGRVLFANGASSGIVNAAGTAVTTWGVPVPAGLGVVADTAGSLFPGKYRYSLTHVRTADNLEGGTIDSYGALDVVSGGISFTGLPVLAGHRTNVYLTSHNGEQRFFAGSTTNAVFAFTGENKDLVRPCRTEFLKPAPAGILVGFWRGRALVAVGSALFASKPNSWELFDLRKDFKAFHAPITLVQPVDGGIWVGTELELVFLAGNKWDDLVRQVKSVGPVVLGSGCSVPGEQIAVGKGRGAGDAMVGIASGWVVAGMPDGSLVPLTLDRYSVGATEVSAFFRMADNVPQYIALPQ